MGRQDTPLPESISRFKIQEVLGRGGMGEVYKAFDTTLQRTVAVKTVRPDIDRPEYLDRMMREAQACARLSHPNIVTIYEAGQANGVVYIAMEYLQGQNLADLLDAKKLPFDEKIRILAKVLEALHHAHGLDVVHRDIKPSNILICADGTIKLMDFGLARVLVADTLTASGNVLGTPHYASPEQLKGEPVDRRTDIYSTGVMAYEMLSGRRPFEPDNDSISSVILKVIQQPAAPMDTDMSRLLPDIETIVQRAMAKSPNDRYQSADEMRKALVEFAERSRARITAIESNGGSTIIVPQGSTVTSMRPPVAASAIPEFTPPSRRAWWAGGAVAAAIVAVLIAAPSRQLDPPSAPSTAANSPSTPTAPAPTPTNTAPPNNPAPAASSASAVTKPAAPGPIATPSKPVENTAVARDLSAKEMFASTDTSNVAPGLRFRLIQAGANDVPMDVDPSKEFKTGDRIRFAFESNIDGYLYVAQQGTSGNWTVLFPMQDINGGRNAVTRHKEYEVPQDGWFEMYPPSGTERLFVFLSREPMKTLPGFEKPVMKSFEAGSAQMIASLETQIQSRDLVFAKDAASSKMQATYVVNKAEVGKAVTASFNLTHK